MIARFGLILALALAFSAVEAEQANAQCGYGGYGYGCGAGHLYGVMAQNVPHFAAFPPVYYSAPVARTYGYSPFAYPPGTMTPDLPSQPVAAKEISNPFFRASNETESPQAEAVEADKVTQSKVVAPLVVVNPYVGSEALHTVALNR